MNVYQAQTDFCTNCYKGFKEIYQLDMQYQHQYQHHQYQYQHHQYQNMHMPAPERKKEKLTKKYNEDREAIRNRCLMTCRRSCVNVFQSATRQDPKDCAECTKFQQELTQKDTIIKELEEANHKTRSELEELKEKHRVFRDRMSIEASLEIGTSGEIFEDISDPSRESELRSSYNKMKTTVWPKILNEIEKKSKESQEETVNKNEEKKRVKKMIKEMFAKAAKDMMEKKTALESFFKISDKTTVNKKQLQCFNVAVQSLQLMIFWEECTCYQDMYKQLGHSSPYYLCELADQCYKQGCLMELHNPPLTPDWDSSDNVCPFPPITKKSVDKR